MAIRTWKENTAKVNGEQINSRARRPRRRKRMQFEIDWRITKTNKEYEKQSVRDKGNKLKHLRRSSTQFIAMWQSKALISTWNAWRMLTTIKIKDKNRLRSFVSKVMNQKLLSVFNTWTEYTQML